MAGCKVVIRMLTPWMGRDEEFSNVFFFGDGTAGLSPDEATATTLINEVIASMKPVFSTQTRFLGGAAYKIGISDTPGDTDAIATVELAASGNQGSAVASTMYRECAIDLKWLLGGRRYLRSLLHTGCLHGYNAVGDVATASSSLATPLKTFAEKMLNGPWTGSYQRIAPDGDRPTVIQYNPFLEHRQFHRYRRRNAGLLG